MIITLIGANFSENKIGTLDTWNIATSLGDGATYSGVTSVDRDPVSPLNATVTIAEGYELGAAGVTVTMGGSPVTEGITVDGNTITINIAAVTGNVVIKVPTKNVNTGEEEEPETPDNYTLTINPDPASATVTLSATGYSTVSGTGSQSITVANGTTVNWSVSASGYTTRTGNWTISGGNKTENIALTVGGSTTTVDYGTLISNPTNLRGGVVDYIIVKPEFYASILNKKITKIRVYKVTDSSSASKTTIGIGKVALSGEFKTSSQTASGLATAYSNISSYKTYDVASYANKTMMELDCDITLSEGEYLCFDVKNGHCVGYCNDTASSQQMMYVYQSQAEPRNETSQQVPISVTVEE